MLGEFGVAAFFSELATVPFLQSSQSHSSAPPVEGMTGDRSRGFALGMVRGTAGELVRAVEAALVLLDR